MNRLFLCLLTICMFSCDKTLGPPKSILSEKTMVSIMADLHMAESKVKAIALSPDSARRVFSIYEMQILEKHQVSPEKYIQSYQYYIDHHRLMTRVSQALLDTLLARQTRLEAIPDSVFELRVHALNKSIAARDSLLSTKARPDSLQKDTVIVDTVGAKPDQGLLKLDRKDSSRKVLRKKKDII